MANEFTERMRRIGFLRGGRSRSTYVVEGRTHPETGVPYKATTDEHRNTVTEHATQDDRVDVQLRPTTVKKVGNG